MDKISYSLGIGIGYQLKDMGGNKLVIDDFAQAIKDVIAGKEPKISPSEAQKIVNAFLAEIEAENTKKAEVVGAEQKKAGEAFLAENAKKEGVMVLPSGLQYTVIKEGTGKKPKATDNVKCHYEGTLIDGTMFDSSIKRGEPAVFPLNGVIAGWTEGLQLMAEGAKYRFFIPYNLGYGARGAGASIPPFSTLIFDVELIEVM
ncbi:MAG: FKBP-type peptidyl-prolyl cis-trans isomerase [Prevotellaceae bacterium]|nr:FKBP-type peptidyl-prolyl cis-trans isomerase [Candidatus Faecinaster equi]